LTHTIIVFAHYHSNIFLDDVYKTRRSKRCRSHTSFHPNLERTALKRDALSATRWAAQSSSIEARAARVAALGTAFFVDPSINEIIYSGDNGEGKYDDTSDDGGKDKDREDNGDEVSGGDDEEADNGRDVDKDEDYVSKDNNDDDDDIYKSSLFDDDKNNSIDDA
jgi:hypothetical protein